MTTTESSLPSVTVLISGRGSNLKALIDRQSGYRVGAVISNKREAPGLTFAEEHGIPTHVIERTDFSSLTAFKDGVLEQTLATKPDLVALAGFMVVLHPHFIDAFRGKLINIHPSLLPLLPGLHTHERALSEGHARHGVTVHYVDAGVDTGPRIAQASFSVAAVDTADDLAKRALTVEHRIYPWVVSRLASGDIHLHGLSVRYSERARREGLEGGFDLF
jgi:phosphoribosylglycinamide formyltransferase-1